MYDIDHQDHVSLLTDVPQSSIGAPLPVVLADDIRVLLGYLAEAYDPDWDGKYVRRVDKESEEPGVVVQFEHVEGFYFGMPNDEAFQGHPLAQRGLRPYSAAKVEHSSWLRRLEQINSVHPDHRPDAFERLSHFVFAFHDSTFECVAQAFTVEKVAGPMTAIVAEMQRRLFIR